MSLSQRVDKWLWHARFAKTRTAAQTLIRTGRVRINRARNTSASRPLKPGDVLTVSIGQKIRVVRVLGIGERRGPAMEAQQLYEELEVLKPTSTGAAPMSPGPRPSGRDRRLLRELKRKHMSQ